VRRSRSWTSGRPGGPAFSASRYSATVRSLPENSADEPLRVGVTGQGDRPPRPQSRGPTPRSAWCSSAAPPAAGSAIPEAASSSLVLALGKAQIRPRGSRPASPARRELMQAQPHIVDAWSVSRAPRGGRVRQQPGSAERVLSGDRQLVEILNNQRDAATERRRAPTATRSTIAGALKFGVSLLAVPRRLLVTGGVTNRAEAGPAQNCWASFWSRCTLHEGELPRAAPGRAGPGAQQATSSRCRPEPR